MQSKRLHKESFLWNDLFHDKNKSEPIANRRKVRIYSLWWRRRESNPDRLENIPRTLRAQTVFLFPRHSQTSSAVGSFICHAGGKAYPGHVHHKITLARLVVLPDRTAA